MTTAHTPKTRVKHWPIMRPELDKIMQWVKEERLLGTNQLNLILLCLLMYSTGCRISEILSLSGSQTQELLAGKGVRVKITKTKTTRELFITSQFAALFNEHLPGFIPAELGIVNSRGAKVSRQLADDWFKPYFKRLHKESGGTQKEHFRFTTHSLRIGFVNRMLAHFSLPEVSNLVGHSSFQTTLIYARSNDDMTYHRNKLESLGSQVV